MNERMTDDMQELLAHLSQPADEPMPPLHAPPPPGTIRLIDVQVYDVPEAALPGLDVPTVESTPQAPDAQETMAPEEPAPMISRHSRQFHPFPLVLAVLCVLFAGAVSLVYVLPLLAPSATVTIIPDSIQISTASTVRVVTGAATAASDQLLGRMLSSITMSQAQTVPTTGSGHQDAQAARGHITFYNAAPAAQTVAAGTLITGTDGVQAVTDQDAVIPAAVFPTDGQITVPAHATITGPTGNIKAGDMYGQCCRLNLFVVNGAFRGGQDARSYPLVTAQDIHGAATGLATSLAQSVQAALQTQVHGDETLITPPACKQRVIADHAVGDEAAQVQITVDEMCTGEVYQTQAYHDLVKQIVSQQASKQVGKGYTLAGGIQATIASVTIKAQDVVDLVVTGSGIWEFQFSQQQLQHIKAMVAGKHEAQAKAILLHVPGVEAVSITFKNGTTIPTDTSAIHFAFVELF